MAQKMQFSPFTPQEVSFDLEDFIDRNHPLSLLDMAVQHCCPEYWAFLFDNGRTALQSTGVGG
jgi:hypothetical protein